MSNPDLNELRRRLHENQRAGNVLPTQDEQRVVAGRNGEIYMGNQVPKEEMPQMATVHQGTFASCRC